MEIKILGTCCSKCTTTYNAFDKAIKEHNLDVKLTKISDIEEIMRYNVMTTPAVVKDEEVKIKGRIPTENEVKELLGL